MQLSFLLWIASVLPQPAADPLCLATTVYLEARDQSELGQRAVAEVALRRQENGRWGDSVCEVVTARKQFAPTLVSANTEVGGDIEAWTRAINVTLAAQKDWQQPLGQRAVAEVALRRQENGRWGDSLCEVVTAPKQFAPTLVNPGIQVGGDIEAWTRAINVALTAQKDWQQPVSLRNEVVPGASHFVALGLAQPAWRNYPTVAKIGDHTFLKVESL